MLSKRLSGRVMYRYETVVVSEKNPQAAKIEIDKHTAVRPKARLAHVTSYIGDTLFSKAAVTKALILTFEFKVEE